ncbi:response regulator [bacterium]|nr:response regulator [bacterium]PIV80900.1 MAG: response regulator [bacterium CG17_big_fil_post_rev_8_21_14_2_50_64_8]PJA74402.1 MAG: response regulator [bacterium CG_4_9_14_3_um_filter_65_15]
MATILLVDDDDQVRMMLSEVIAKEGHTMVEAADGNQAVRLYDPDTIDLVITDIVMPEKEGLETIREIRAVNPDVRIIAISGGGRIKPEDYLDWANRIGVDRTFAKPVRRVDLLKAVNDLLGVEVA